MMIASLPRREREIFEILCSAGEATAADVRRAMADPPSHSAVRTMLARLEAKGLVSHRSEEQLERKYRRDALTLTLVAAGLFLFGLIFVVGGILVDAG